MPGTPQELVTVLLSLTALMRSVYHPEVINTHPRWQGTLNKLIEMDKRQISGNGITIQVIDRRAYASRWGKDINGSYPDPQPMNGSNYTVTLSDTAGSNDFGILKTSASLSTLDMKRNGSLDSAAIADFKERTFKECVDDVAESRAIHQYLPTSGLLGLVNGTPTKNDADIWTEASSLTTTGGARIKIDTGSLAYFMPGRKISIYNGSGSTAVKRCDAMVTDINPRDLSAGINELDANGNPTTTNSSGGLQAISDNDGLYVQDEKDQCPISLGSWLTRVAGTSGASDTFFNRDRNSQNYRYMKPHFSGPPTARPLSLGDIDAAGTEAGYITEDPEGAMIMFGRVEMVQTYQNLVGKDVFIQFPNDDEKGKLLANYGFQGAVHRHARFGRVMLNPDPLMKENTLWFLKPGCWEMLHTYAEKFLWQQGDVGYWYRTNDPTNNGARTNIWRADGESIQVVICTHPRSNIVIENIQPTATVSAA